MWSYNQFIRGIDECRGISNSDTTIKNLFSLKTLSVSQVALLQAQQQHHN